MGIEKDLAGYHEKYDMKRGPAEFVSSGILSLDCATRVGIPRGCIIDLYGEEGLGKTTLSLSIVGERVKHGERCAYIDVEHRLSPKLVSLLIPDPSLMEIFHPLDGDAALACMERLAHHPEIRMIVMDSLAAIVPGELLEEDASPDGPIALTARRIASSIKKVMTPLVSNNCVLIAINQIRMKPMSMGDPRIPTGGKALKFFASLRMNMLKDSFIKDGDVVSGQRVNVIMEKNSFAAPFGKATLNIVYGRGVDKDRDMVDCGIQTGVIVKSSSWLSYKDEAAGIDIKAHGERDLVEKIAPHMETVREKISAALMAKTEAAQ